MSATHTVTVEADPDDGTPNWFAVTFACNGNPDDLCRQWCTVCEEECTGNPIINGHLIEVIAQAPVDGHPYAPYHDGQSCRIVDWLEAGDAEDTYIGEDEPLRVGTHVINEEWTGDEYVWQYAEDGAVTA